MAQLEADASIASRRHILSQHPAGHRNRPSALNNLANAIRTRYVLFGDVEDIEEAIILYREALSLRPMGHSNRPASLGNLALAIRNRYARVGDVRDLDEAIALNREALLLRPVGHIDRSSSLDSLANAVWCRYGRFGDVEDINESIALHREALLLRPAGHRDRPASLGNLALAIRKRYRRFGDLEDINEAIALNRESLSLRPAGHKDRASSLDSLANTIWTRYTRFGNVEDINEAISLHREALSLRPIGHSNRSSSLRNLALAIRRRYTRSGDVKDIDEAIALNREAVFLRVVGHDDRPLAIDSLANAIWTRYGRFGNVEDINESIALHRSALLLRPVGHNDRPSSLGNLALAVTNRYERFGNVDDIEEAIALNREALSLRPSGHNDRPSSLGSLALAITSRYERLKDVRDIDEAITLNREALLLRPKGHNDRSASLSNLALILRKRYECFGGVECIDEAVGLFREVLSLSLPGQLNRPYTSGKLGESLVVAASASRNSGEPFQSLIDEAQALLDTAITDSGPSINWQLVLALRNAGKDIHGVNFRLSMCLRCIDLLQQYVVISPNILDQLASVSTQKSVASTICAYAVEAGSPETAVAGLDGGRSLLLGIMQKYRSPVDELREANHELADELRATGIQLEQLSMLGDTEESESVPEHTTESEFRMITQRRLREQWDQIISRIRGFEHFLSTPPYSELQMAASEGPIILLNACERRCNGIIVFFSGPPEVLSFQNCVSPKGLKEMYERLDQSRSARFPGNKRDELCFVLRFLWNNVVSPIVTCLQSSGVMRGSRVWWCPASIFGLFPLHAAGLYREDPGCNFLNLYISSYTPTVSELLRARRASHTPSKTHTSPPDHRPVAFIGHSGEGELLNVEKELEAIRGLDGIIVSPLLNSQATPDTALEVLATSPRAHFACHGVVHTKTPTESYFELEGRHLTVKDIIGAKLDGAELAFLSACESAAPGVELPDEAIHLTSALMFAGFRSVVGTMWEMPDSEGPLVAKLFYQNLIKLGGRHTDAAKALQLTIKARCREDARERRFRPERWAMFIHIGA